MSNRVGHKIRRNVCLAGAITALGGAAQAQNISWSSDGTTAAPGITPSIFLTDNNVAAVEQFLAAQQGLKVIKIPTQISNATIDHIYNNYKVDYTFADFEGASSAAQTSNLVSRIQASAATGPAFGQNKAFVSNFALAPLYGDGSGPGPSAGNDPYISSGVNMASEELYPGSPVFRNPAMGNSTAPNVRSALFTLPIAKLSMTSSNLPAGHAHIAYVDRFNNWLNNALDSDGDPSNGYKFVTQNQLPSRGDFQAQVMHYRLRGATGVHGLQGGVVGYTQAQFEGDINDGWNSLPAVNQIFAQGNARVATLDTVVQSDGSLKTIETAGVVASGVYSTTLGKLALLLSNLDENAHSLSFPSKIGGKTIPGDYTVLAGKHELLEFGAAGSTWNLVSLTEVFADVDRAGVGVPEPSMIGAAGAAAAMMATRRRRQTRQLQN